MKNIKQPIMIMMALLITTTIIPFKVQAAPSQWAQSSVAVLESAGVIPPEQRNSYQNPIQRDEFTAVLVRCLESALNKEMPMFGNPFTDITSNPYKVEIEKARSISLINGTSESTFSPRSTLTREQAAVIFSNFIEVFELNPSPSGTVFSDSEQISSWAISSVTFVCDLGVMSGVGDNKFDPKGQLTREQAYALLYRTIDLLVNETSDKFDVRMPEAVVESSQPTQSQTLDDIDMQSLTINPNLKKGMTDEQFKQAYDAAYSFVRELGGLSKMEQVEAVYYGLGMLRHGGEWTYSMEDEHYSDVYGFFALRRTSCAGDVRAAALCLTILGIPHEHVNENQWDHQWLRVNVDGEYIVLDINMPFIGYELEPNKHPLLP